LQAGRSRPGPCAPVVPLLSKPLDLFRAHTVFMFQKPLSQTDAVMVYSGTPTRFPLISSGRSIPEEEFTKSPIPCPSKPRSDINQSPVRQAHGPEVIEGKKIIYAEHQTVSKSGLHHVIQNTLSVKLRNHLPYCQTLATWTPRLRIFKFFVGSG